MSRRVGTGSGSGGFAVFRALALGVLAAGGLPGAGARAQEPPPPAAPGSVAEAPPADQPGPGADIAPVLLPAADSRDVPAEGRLFERGMPVTGESFSSDEFHFAHLFQIRGGFPRRIPKRCVFLLDLATGGNRPAETPQGEAVRIGGWDPTGRYLLVEAQKRGLFSSLTGGFTTYHWILDTVTGEYVSRKRFTGRRGEQRFLWKKSSTYHGAWAESGEPLVVPLFDGELAERYRNREEAWKREDERRAELSRRLTLTTRGGPTVVLADVLQRLDEHWTRRGHRDPVVSEVFGGRPGLDARVGDEWRHVLTEVDFLAVLDRDLCLVTVAHGAQYLYHVGRHELLPLAAPPEAWATSLDLRWDRNEEVYDERDPLPRDIQYRRSTTTGRGTAQYFNYVLPERSRVLLLYWLGPEERVLRIVDLPESWRAAVPESEAR